MRLFGQKLVDADSISEADVEALRMLRKHLHKATTEFGRDEIAATIASAAALVLIRDEDVTDYPIVGIGLLFEMVMFDVAVGYVHSIVRHPNYRGRGVGNAIMTAIITIAQSRGLDYIELSSNDRRAAAISLYATMGFDQLATNHFRLDLKSVHNMT